MSLVPASGGPQDLQVVFWWQGNANNLKNTFKKMKDLRTGDIVTVTTLSTHITRSGEKALRCKGVRDAIDVEKTAAPKKK